MERPLRLAGTDPERVYKTAEIKNLKIEKEKDEDAAPIIRKVWPTGTDADALQGRVDTKLKGKQAVVEYEPDTDLRDTEQIPLLHEGGINAFLEKEVLPYSPDAWYNPEAVRVGYEINFNRHFYKPQPMRSLEEIRAGYPGTGKGDGGPVGGNSGEMSNTKAGLKPYPGIQRIGDTMARKVPNHWTVAETKTSTRSRWAKCSNHSQRRLQTLRFPTSRL